MVVRPTRETRRRAGATRPTAVVYEGDTRGFGVRQGVNDSAGPLVRRLAVGCLLARRRGACASVQPGGPVPLSARLTPPGACGTGELPGGHPSVRAVQPAVGPARVPALPAAAARGEGRLLRCGPCATGQSLVLWCDPCCRHQARRMRGSALSCQSVTCCTAGWLTGEQAVLLSATLCRGSVPRAH